MLRAKLDRALIQVLCAAILVVAATSIELRAQPRMGADSDAVLNAANLLVVAEVLIAKDPVPFVAGEQYGYTIKVVNVVGGADAPDKMEVWHSHYRSHKRGEMIVHPLYYSSGKELSLAIGQPYLLFLRVRDSAANVELVRAEGLEERDRLTAAWNRKLVFLGTIMAIHKSPVARSELPWVVETRVDKLLMGSIGG